MILINGISDLRQAPGIGSLMVKNLKRTQHIFHSKIRVIISELPILVERFDDEGMEANASLNSKGYRITSPQKCDVENNFRMKLKLYRQ